MADEIRPALTPEEWGHGQFVGCDVKAWRKSRGVDGSQRIDIEMLRHPLGGAGGDVGDMHALAALCLYQQPFGFTQEDVEALRRVANVRACGAVADGVTDDTPAFQRAIRLASLADRIAALLPPTNTDA